MKKPRHFVGLNKGGHDSNACLITSGGRKTTIVMYLKERLTRVKAEGGFPTEPVRAVEPKIRAGSAVFAESGYPGKSVDLAENTGRRLEKLSSRFNPDLLNLRHHYCHAMAALAFSPFKKSVIVVFDGSGSAASKFPENDSEIKDFSPSPGANWDSVTESLSVYLQDSSRIRCVHKTWQTFTKDHRRPPEGLGYFYEMSARYIFHSKREAGKVMGLAPFGKPGPIRDRVEYFEDLGWKRAFPGGGKRAWESSGEIDYYSTIAASVQRHFEESLFEFLKSLRKKHPAYRNLILTGGCALNCVANMKVLEAGFFDRVYVPAFPSDESIGLGAATHLRLRVLPGTWRPTPMARQKANFGPLESIPTGTAIREAFAGYKIERPRNIHRHAASLLARGKILGWFQSRSESGPRALGYRSILAHPGIQGHKDRLNGPIKGRESFRPYALSCLLQETHRYFEVPKGFESPFMSFAPKMRERHKHLLSEVRHVDGTSRIQTVRRSQNEDFYRLIREFRRVSGIPGVLNTSMNVMGEPIVETVQDARRFLENVPVDGLVIGDCFISRSCRTHDGQRVI